MISQVGANSAGTPPGNTGQAAPLVDVKPQRAAVPVELPGQAVKAVADAVDTEAAKKAAEQINRALKQFDNNIQFSVDENNKTHVQVVDTQTKEVIRTMPSKEMLAISQAIEKFQGLLIKIKA
ncbi:MAG: flagellar protein FlaG [Nitrosomonadales bacterium]|nr:flagellar protein FlaG [Nitrosomonadales bacterium]